MMKGHEIDAAIYRVRQIDEDFEAATGWGSWMVMCANERERLVNALQKAGVDIAHKYQARNADGSRTD